jgi:hypothetical protein
VRETLRVVGEVAGLGGLAIGVVLLVYLEILKTKVLSPMNAKQTFRTLISMLLLTALVAIVGLVIWLLSRTTGAEPSGKASKRNVGELDMIYDIATISERAAAINERTARLLAEITSGRLRLVPLNDPGLEERKQLIRRYDNEISLLRSEIQGLKQLRTPALDQKLGKAEEGLGTIKLDYSTAREFHLTNNPAILLNRSPDIAIAIIEKNGNKAVYRENEKSDFLKDVGKALKSGVPRQLSYGRFNFNTGDCTGPGYGCADLDIDSNDGGSVKIQWHSRTHRVPFDEVLAAMDRGELKRRLSITEGTVCAWYERGARTLSSDILLRVSRLNPLAMTAKAKL